MESDYWSSDAVRSYFVAKRPNERLESCLKTAPNFLQAIGSVLDAGCGYGRNLVPFSGRACELYAFDPCADALIYTRQRHSMCEDHARISRIEDDPWRGERWFDLVVCDGVLHQCQSVDGVRHAVEYLSDIISPGGCLFISVFTSDVHPAYATHCGNGVWRTDKGVVMTLACSFRILQMFGDVGLSIVDVWHDVFELDVGRRSNLTLLLRRENHAK